MNQINRTKCKQSLVAALLFIQIEPFCTHQRQHELAKPPALSAARCQHSTSSAYTAMLQGKSMTCCKWLNKTYFANTFHQNVGTRNEHVLWTRCTETNTQVRAQMRRTSAVDWAHVIDIRTEIWEMAGWKGDIHHMCLVSFSTLLRLQNKTKVVLPK